jgi:hypothetical protein
MALGNRRIRRTWEREQWPRWDWLWRDHSARLRRWYERRAAVREEGR